MGNLIMSSQKPFSLYKNHDRELYKINTLQTNLDKKKSFKRWPSRGEYVEGSSACTK